MKTVEYDLSAIADDTNFIGEDSIRADLEGGNVWVWACVKVTACIDGIKAFDYLGGCSYKSEDDFRKGAHYLDMKGEALSELRMELEDILERAEKELAAERAAYDKRMAATKRAAYDKRMAATELWRCPYCKDVVSVDSDYDDIPFCADCDTQRDPFEGY